MVIRTPRQWIGSVLCAIAVVFVCSGVASAAAQATALWQDLTTSESRPGHLLVRAVNDPASWVNLESGVPQQWIIDFTVREATAENVQLEFLASGGLIEAYGLRVSLEMCEGEYRYDSNTPGRVPVCGGVTSQIEMNADMLQSARAQEPNLYTLPLLMQDTVRSLLVTVTATKPFTETFESAQRLNVGVGIHVSGGEAASSSGTDVTPVTAGGYGSNSRLETTGSINTAVWLLGLGFGGLVCGALLMRPDRQRVNTSVVRTQ